MGGVYNLVNLQLYHYAGNNPVKYTDLMGLANIEADHRFADEFRDKNGDIRSPTYLNERLAEVSKGFVGGKYKYGGEKPSTEGGEGIDCSANPLIAAERVSGESLRDRNANGILTDKKLVKLGHSQKGSLNGFDWKTNNHPNGDNIFDHITVITGEGTEIHPSSNSGTIMLIPEGSVDRFAGKKVNYEFNWRYILGKE